MCYKCEEIRWDSQKKPAITGEIFGVDFYDSKYTMDDEEKVSKQFRVFVEDDGLWHYTGLSASVFWLQDLLNTVVRAILPEGSSNG